jgi:hypothetical protein
VVSYLALSVWMSIYLSFNWDRKMDRYLHQPAIPHQPLEEEREGEREGERAEHHQ